MTCPQAHELEVFVRGGHLSPPVTEHISGCDVCQAEMSKLRSVSVDPATKVVGAPLSLSPDAVGLEPGARLGRYVIVSGIGEGGMGAVYLAYDPGLDRRVAVKLLNSVGNESASARARLEREAQALARVSHPNTVAVYDVGTSGSQVFIAMEHLEGATLRDWLHQATRSHKQIVATFLQAARGLAAVHAAGLVHRDFKPANVIVTTAGVAKVLDFGLARLEGHSDPTSGEREAPSPTPEVADATPRRRVLDESLTEAGNVLGTPGFVAPELLEGAAAAPSSDQFAFGVCLYQALFGVRPFAGSDFASYLASLRSGPAKIPAGTQVPTWLSTIALKCLAARPSDRFPSMTALLAALENDPARQRRLWGWGVTAALAIASALWLGSRMGPHDDCPSESELNASVWRASSPALIRNRLATARPGFTPRIELTLKRVGEAATKWSKQAHDSCEAVRQPKPALIAVQREACLARQNQALMVLVDAVAQADASIVPRIDEVVEHFLEGLGCESDQAVMRVRPDDVPLAQKGLASRLRAQLFRARVLSNMKNLNEAFHEAAAVAGSASEAGLRGFESEAKQILGDIEVARGNSDQAMARYQEAFKLGIQAGTDERTFYAGASLIRQIREFRERIGEAKQVMLMVEGLFDRLGRDPSLEMELLSTRADISDAQGKLPEAIAFERKKLELAKTTWGERSRASAEALQTLSHRLWKNGQIVEANELDATKFDFFFELYGPNDPFVLQSIPEISRGLREEGRSAAALELLEPGLAHAGVIVSADDETTSKLRLELSRVLEESDRARSLELAEQALAFYEKGSSSAGLADALTQKARALSRAGRGKEALVLCERAEKLRVEFTDTGGEHRRGRLMCTALAYQTAEPGRAVRFWKEALAVKPEALPGTRAEISFRLAQALARSGAKRNEVESWVSEARKAYGLFPDFADRLAEVDEWFKTVPSAGNTPGRGPE